MRLMVPFDLDFSLCCGQVFRWRKIGDWWYGVVGKHVFKIRQCGVELDFEGVGAEFVEHYFGLRDDLAEISRIIGRDAFIRRALRQFEGLRLVRQEPWECLVGFICSSYKSIAAIELMLQKLSEKFGEEQEFDGRGFFVFPTASRLAEASLGELRECGLGFRAKYVKSTAEMINKRCISLEDLRALSYLDAQKELLRFPGVGLKVADCVLLFSLGKMEAFPVDVWVKRVILNHYANLLPEDFVSKLHSHDSLTNQEYRRIGAFARDYFGAYAGYAQEYLYHYERTQR
jgi:N-glycosylase/DNA lyase